MISLPSILKNSKATFQSFKQQPYVYSYRIMLFIAKNIFIQKLLKTYVNHSLKRVRKEVNTLNTLTIESISKNRLLSKNHFTYLYALCRFLKPKIVVETGVGFGISSKFILQALQDNGFGELYSIDYPRSKYSSDAGIQINESSYTTQVDLPGYIIPDYLRKQWTLLLGRSRDVLPPLCKRLGEIDLFFHDSEHTYQNMISEYETVWPYLRENGILASHDIDWNGAFNEFIEKNKCNATISGKRFGFIFHKQASKSKG